VKGLESARYRAQRSGYLLQEAEADFAIGLHLAEPVKGYAGDAHPLQCYNGSEAATLGMFVAQPAYRLPHAEALADCSNPSGSDL
jgi:hypothetical protein